MWKKRLRGFIALGMCAVMAWPAYASSVDALQDSINQLQQQQQQIENDLNNIQQSNNQIQNDMNNTQQNTAQLQQQKEALEKSIQELDDQMMTAAGELNDIRTRLDANQQQIEQIQQQKAQAEEQVSRQYEDMKKRIQYMYEQGQYAYLEMFLSAVDMNDFINKADFVNEIMDYDRQMLQQYQNTKQAVADSEARLQQDREALSQLEGQANARVQELENLTAQKAAQVENYNQLLASNQALTEEYQKKLDEQNAIFQQLEAAAASNQAAQSDALAALSQAVATAGEEQKAQAEQQAAQAWLQQASTTEQAELQKQGYNITVDPNTLFAWPCPNYVRISSEYGWREHHPIYGDRRFHNGIDISSETGNPIVAAYKGVVIGAGYDSGMGNYVMLDHGNGLVTVYMHASFLCVALGHVVEKGQLIALVGSTGDSTGPHLHFSTRLNGTYVSPWNYVTQPQQ